MKVVYVGLVVIVAYCITLINLDSLGLWWTNKKEYHVNIDETDISSSVWCHVTGGNRICTFRNVCYVPKGNQFLFFLTENSILLGLKSKEDLQTIKLSSVLNHNLFFMNLVIAKWDKVLQLKKEDFISEPLFLLWRFKWDNIMHVIHDDILPLFVTYLHICKNIDLCVSKYRLGFVDNGEYGPFIDVYKFFSNRMPLLLQDLKNFVCFKEVQAGLLTNSVWFQYGFGKPHGPIISNLSSSVLNQFKKFIFQRYNISSQRKDNRTIVFLNRNLNRKILNKEYLVSVMIDTVQKIHPLIHPRVVELDISTHNISYVIETISSNNIVVGMHGSAMILCLFLNPGSVVIEIFPYAIEPENVSFLKAFNHMKGTGIIYRNWTNSNENNSVPHPDAPALLGGIHHLSLQTQKLIKEIKKVPAVECCHNPTYLYRMFQDTTVDSSFITCFQDALAQQILHSEQNLKITIYEDLFLTWFYPSKVEEVSCFIYNNTLSVTWQPPLNSQIPIAYDVAFAFNNNETYGTNTKECLIQMELDQAIDSVKVWIKALSPYGEGLDVHLKCEKT